MKRIASLLLIPAALFLAVSCDKEGGKGDGASGTAILSVTVNGLEGLLEIPENSNRTYDVLVTADPGPSDAISVTLGADQTLVDKYNAANGTSYQMLPQAAYELSADGLILMRYNKKSTTGTLTLKGTGCVRDQTYLLPVVVSTVKGTAPYDAPEDKAAYILFKMVAPQFDGAGTEADPYLVKTVGNFADMGYMLASGKYVYFKMAANVDFGGAAWTQVDTRDGKGIFFDGGGHKISNVTATASLFTSLEGGVKNLQFENVDVTAGSTYAGVLAETSGYGVLIENIVISNSSVSNTNCCGGLIGSINGTTIRNVDVDCSVSGRMYVGGLLGRVLNGTIDDCHATGNVTSTAYYAGGLVGLFTLGTVTNSSAAGNVSASGDDIYARIGGLVGQMHGGTVDKCFATGDVASANYWGGGLVGVVNADEDDIFIKRSYATGDLNFVKNEEHKMAGVGGLVGSMGAGNVTIENCYASGAIHADRWSSGFVGNIYGGNLAIINGYSACDLSDLGPAKAKDADGNWNGGYVHEDGIVLGNDMSGTETPAKISCTGFVALNLYERAFCYPENVIPYKGNYYGREGTVSAQASALGWSTDVWNLTGDYPVLK